jgi:hypothetical protein
MSTAKHRPRRAEPLLPLGGAILRSSRIVICSPRASRCTVLIKRSKSLVDWNISGQGLTSCGTRDSPQISQLFSARWRKAWLAPARWSRVWRPSRKRSRGPCVVVNSGAWRTCYASKVRFLGEVARGAATLAEDHFLQGLDLARRPGAPSWELRCATSLARLWRDQARSKEARELLAPVYDRFTEVFATADLRAAKALLEELL